MVLAPMFKRWITLSDKSLSTGQRNWYRYDLSSGCWFIRWIAVSIVWTTGTWAIKGRDHWRWLWWHPPDELQDVPSTGGSGSSADATGWGSSMVTLSGSVFVCPVSTEDAWLRGVNSSWRIFGKKQSILSHVTCQRAEYLWISESDLLCVLRSTADWEWAVRVHSSSSNIPAVDITNNMFFNDSGIASNCRRKPQE